MIDLNPFKEILEKHNLEITYIPEDFYIQHGAVCCYRDFCNLNEFLINKCVVRYNKKYNCNVLVDYTMGFNSFIL